MFYAYHTVHEDDSRLRFLSVVEFNPDEPTIVRTVAYVNLTRQTVIKRSQRILRILDAEDGVRLRLSTRREYDGDINEYVRDPWFVRLDLCLAERRYEQPFAIKVEATLARIVPDTSIRVSERRVIPINDTTEHYDELADYISQLDINE
jgi:hypothetical protein